MKNSVTLFIPISQCDTIWKGEFKNLPPNETYKLIINYPLYNPATFNIKTGKNGIGLIKLISIIGKKYQYIYDNGNKYRIYGHDIGGLQLEGIRVNHKKKEINLDIGL